MKFNTPTVSLSGCLSVILLVLCISPCPLSLFIFSPTVPRSSYQVNIFNWKSCFLCFFLPNFQKSDALDPTQPTGSDDDACSLQRLKSLCEILLTVAGQEHDLYFWVYFRWFAVYSVHPPSLLVLLCDMFGKERFNKIRDGWNEPNQTLKEKKKKKRENKLCSFASTAEKLWDLFWRVGLDLYSKKNLILNLTWPLLSSRHKHGTKRHIWFK